jgi:hypothetical protein
MDYRGYLNASVQGSEQTSRKSGNSIVVIVSDESGIKKEIRQTHSRPLSLAKLEM